MCGKHHQKNQAIKAKRYKIKAEMRSARIGSITTKRCRSCTTEKPIDEFYRNKFGRSPSTYKTFSKKLSALNNRLKREREGQKFPSGKVCLHCHKTKPIAEFRPPSADNCHGCDLDIRAVSDAVNKVVRDGPRRHVKQDISSGFKVCKTCTERLPLSDFSKSRITKTGVSYYNYKSDCMPCTNKRARFYGRDWTRKNQTLQRAKERRRRGIKRGAEGTHTAEDVTRIRKAQKDRCCMPWCRVKLNKRGHVEHRIPLWAGGSNDARNLQLACQPCNSSKGVRDEIEFVQSRNLLGMPGQLHLL